MHYAAHTIFVVDVLRKHSEQFHDKFISLATVNKSR